MLMLIEESESRKAAQARLEHNLTTSQGEKNIAFRGGAVSSTVYAAVEKQLWAAFRSYNTASGKPYYWNAFGIYEPRRAAQQITVEINIAIDGDSARFSGFYAKDEGTGDIYMMHSGRVGGGRKGIGQSAFLACWNQELDEIAAGNGGIRRGIRVCKLDDPDITDHLWDFVQKVDAFKTAAVSGSLITNAL